MEIIFSLIIILAGAIPVIAVIWIIWGLVSLWTKDK